MRNAEKRERLGIVGGPIGDSDTRRTNNGSMDGGPDQTEWNIEKRWIDMRLNSDVTEE
jgi:hypothetical protein